MLPSQLRPALLTSATERRARLLQLARRVRLWAAALCVVSVLRLVCVLAADNVLVGVVIEGSHADVWPDAAGFMAAVAFALVGFAGASWMSLPLTRVYKYGLLVELLGNCIVGIMLLTVSSIVPEDYGGSLLLVYGLVALTFIAVPCCCYGSCFWCARSLEQELMKDSVDSGPKTKPGATELEYRPLPGDVV
eukprot:gnl/Hemi2/26463_TR8886_c0_g1_i1.p1 gnl/Hemi2/26463_TR8886_c0_g1~~gnl/Hemi2/26463_TR8886_c0_g1_i1.p1  ORF type:complete len:192 (-),score=58.63 gnl/Hemi2/26463_TR8886_c0_g1_i1:304-879(-)